MMRFAWIQARTQVLVALGCVALIGIGAAVTAPHLLHLYHVDVAHCAAYSNCPLAQSTFLRHDAALRNALGLLLTVVPALLGVFWGAPLVARELEAGTFRLAWTQSVTRTRWLAAKLAVVGLAAAATAGLFSLALTWWASPFDRVGADLYGTFDQRDLVPIGYALLAVALGVAIGAWVRRPLPAMAATLVGFVAVRVVATKLIRPKLFPAAHEVLALNPESTGYGSSGGPLSSHSANLIPAPPNVTNAWVSSVRIVDEAGHALTPQGLSRACPTLAQGLAAPPPAVASSSRGGLLHTSYSTHGQAPAGAQGALQSCVTKIGATYHELVTYQPASRYWGLQWAELGVYVAGALALGGLCLWVVRRRLT